MVRFSDMLGGSGRPDDASAAESPYAALASDAANADEHETAGPDGDGEDGSDAVKEPVPMSAYESPEAVLDRLTQYATSHVAEPATATEPERPAAEPLAPVGDDFLPRVRGLVRKVGRSRKRHT